MAILLASMGKFRHNLADGLPFHLHTKANDSSCRYGYISFEKFVDAIQAVKDGKATIQDIDKRGLPTLVNTIATGAILEAGRRSLDEKRTIDIVRSGSGEEDWSLQ